MKYRLVLKKNRQQRAIDDAGGDPGAEAIARMHQAGYFRQAPASTDKAPIPASINNPVLRAALERLQAAGTPTPSDDAVSQIFGNVPDYSALSDVTEAARRKRLGYPAADEVFDTFAEDTDEPARATPQRRRRPLFPDAPLSWDDVE